MHFLGSKSCGSYIVCVTELKYTLKEREFEGQIDHLFRHPALFQVWLATPFLLISTQQLGDSLFVAGKDIKILNSIKICNSKKICNSIKIRNSI